MQTTIKDDFDAGLPGDLAVLPSFRSRDLPSRWW